jgi:hypothetical protein
MDAVHQAIAEIEAELARIDPIYEGLNDYAALDLQPDTKAEVQRGIVVYQQRISLLNAAHSALTALVGDGYPILDLPDVTPAVKADLQANADTILAALAEFDAAEPASALKLSADSPEPKA